MPPRVAAAVERAMAKDPRDRFESMDELAAELETCLAGLDPEADAAATMIVEPRAPAERAAYAPAAAPRRRRSPWPALLLAAGILLLAAVAAAALWGGLPGDGGAPADDGAAETSGPVRLSAVRAWDPQGDDREHDDTALQATDGSMDTFWRTERYRDGLAGVGKEGVGLVLDAGEDVELGRLVVRTSTPGFTAEVHAGATADGPFDRVVSPSQTVGETAEFPIEGAAARYYLLWITELSGPRAEIRNVTAQRR